MKPEYPNTPYQRWLAAHYACEDAREWVGSRTPAEAWQACPRADWLLWQVARCNPPGKIRAALVTLARGFAARAARASAEAARASEAERVDAVWAARAARASADAADAYAAYAEWEARAASAAMAASADAADAAAMADEVRSALPPVLPELEN